MTTRSVADDEGVQAVQRRLDELEARRALLRERHHLLSHVGAHRLDQRVPVPAAVAGVTPADAQREMLEIEAELATLARRVNAEQGALTLADVAAQATILESEAPQYRRLIEARDRAKAGLDAREGDIQAFLVDLQRRGVFQPPTSAKKE